MSIRLNLLAETQAAEEQRRRDPVKRAIWVAGLLVSLMLAWSGYLQLRAMLARAELGRVEGRMNSHTNDYQKVQINEKSIRDAKLKLENLQKLASNRFLNGNLLNALQQTTVEDVQLIHVRADQNYLFTEGTKNRTNDNRVIPGKPSTWTEKIVITLDATDTSATLGEQLNKFRDTVADHAYFLAFSDKTNQVYLKGYGQPQVNPETGKQFMLFALECRFPEKTR